MVDGQHEGELGGLKEVSARYRSMILKSIPGKCRSRRKGSSEHGCHCQEILGHVSAVPNSSFLN